MIPTRRPVDSSGALTEADVLGLLRAKLTKPGDGGASEFALLAHVRNRAGFDARRTFDAVAEPVAVERVHAPLL